MGHLAYLVEFGVRDECTVSGAIEKPEGNARANLADSLSQCLLDWHCAPAVEKSDVIARGEPPHSQIVALPPGVCVGDYHLGWRAKRNTPHAIETQCAEPHGDGIWPKGQEAKNRGAFAALDWWELSRLTSPHVHKVARRRAPSSDSYPVPCHRPSDAVLSELLLGQETELPGGQVRKRTRQERIVHEENG